MKTNKLYDENDFFEKAALPLFRKNQI